MDNSFFNSFQALEDNDQEYNNPSFEDLMDEDKQKANLLSNKLGSSSSGSSMANSCSESKHVGDSKCSSNEMGVDQDIQNVNPLADKLGTSSSESIANSSSDKGSSEDVKASDNTSNEDSSLSLVNLGLNDEKGMDQDIQNVNPPANELGSSYSGSMAISSSDKCSSENVKASDEDLSLSLANVSLNDEMVMDQEIQKVNPPANELGSSSSGVEDSSIYSTAASDNNPFTEDLSLISSQKPCLKNNTSEEHIQKVPSSVETQQFDSNEDDNNDPSSAPNFNDEGEFQQLDPNPNVEGSRSFIWPSMGEEGFQNLMHIVDKLESVSRIRSVNTIFEEALDCCCIFDMMTSAYGHQVFGKLVGLLDERNNGKLVEQISKNQLLISVSLYEYGSISVQKLIEVIHNHNKTPSIRKLTEALAEGTHTLLTHERGKHVVLKCFGILEFDDCETLYEALRRQCVKIARHEVGWISLCQCIDHMKNPQRSLFIDGVVLKNRLPLSWTSYGIQVLEYVIRLQDPYLSEKFCSLFKDFERLSFTREGARLVQICLLQSKSTMRLVVEKFLKGEGLAKLACDKYGNHVIQTALEITMGTDIEMHQCLFEALEPHMPTLKFHPTGKALYQLIDQKRR